MSTAMLSLLLILCGACLHLCRACLLLSISPRLSARTPFWSGRRSFVLQELLMCCTTCGAIYLQSVKACPPIVYVGFKMGIIRSSVYKPPSSPNRPP